MKSEFKVGQVWKNFRSYPGKYFFVVRIEDGCIYAYNTDDKRHRPFCYVGDVLDKGWIECSDEYNKNDWMAWRHSAPGDCVCGIPKSLCDYHR